MTDKLEKHKTDLTGYYQEWLSDPSNTTRLRDKSLAAMGQFIESDGTEKVKPLYHNLSAIKYWYLVHGFHNTLAEGELDLENLGQFLFCGFWGLRVCHGLRASGLNPRADFSDKDIVHFSALLAAGWRKQAEQFGQMAHHMRDLDGVPEPLAWSVLPKPQELISILLMRDILQLDWPLMHEPDMEEMGPYGALLQVWKDPDVRRFTTALDAAAERHVADCGYDDILFPNTDSRFWLWPVELLAVCRAREWQGLPPARPEHPLFHATPLGQLPHPIPVPKPDSRIDTALRLFARLSNGAMPYPD